MTTEVTSSETITLDSLNLDFSRSSGNVALPDPGLYLFRVERVRDAKREDNTYYQPEKAKRPEPGQKRQDGEFPVPHGRPYVDGKTGYWVYPKRVSVLIECRPLADSREDFNNLAPIYVYFDLLESRDGGYRPGKQLRELITACFGNTMKAINTGQALRELEGATFWALLAHQKARNSDKVYGKVTGFTDRVPQRYLDRTRDQAHDGELIDDPESIANDARYGTEDDGQQKFDVDDEQADDAEAVSPIEQTLIDQITRAHDTDYLTFLVDRAMGNGTYTPAVERAHRAKAGTFRSAARKSA